MVFIWESRHKAIRMFLLVVDGSLELLWWRFVHKGGVSWGVNLD